jgi:hypothetical protein
LAQPCGSILGRHWKTDFDATSGDQMKVAVIGLCVVLALGLPAVAGSEKRNVLVLASRDSQQPAYEQFMPSKGDTE